MHIMNTRHVFTALLIGVGVGMVAANVAGDAADRHYVRAAEAAEAQRDSAIATARAAGWALAELQAAANGPDDHAPAPTPACPSPLPCLSGY